MQTIALPETSRASATPTSHRADIEEDRRRRRDAVAVAGVEQAHRLRGQRDQHQKREHDARQQHREFELARHVLEARRHQPDQLRREEHPRRADCADHQDQRGGREVRELLRVALAARLQILREDRDERRGERALPRRDCAPGSGMRMPSRKAS